MFGRDLSIAHVDIDHFRAINERHGTPVGDRVLRSCAQALQSCVRGSDLVARFSGEEFIVVLPGADPQIARQVAQRMLSALATADHDPQTGDVRVTASIGVATYTTKQRFAEHARAARSSRSRAVRGQAVRPQSRGVLRRAADRAARADRFLANQLRERRLVDVAAADDRGNAFAAQPFARRSEQRRSRSRTCRLDRELGVAQQEAHRRAQLVVADAHQLIDVAAT